MTNLQAMSLLALLVGFFLIYSAVSFAVVQRRAVVGVLRALGATRREVLATLLGEAALIGTVGALLGLLLGVMIGHALVRLVAGTINDLYFVVAVDSSVTLPAGVHRQGAACRHCSGAHRRRHPRDGSGARAAAAMRGSSAPCSRSARSGRRAGFLHRKRWLCAAAPRSPSSLDRTRSLLAGFSIALFLPPACASRRLRRRHAAGARTRARRAASRSAAASPIAYAWRSSDIAASLSRTGVAVAALSLAVCAMIRRCARWSTASAKVAARLARAHCCGPTALHHRPRRRLRTPGAAHRACTRRGTGCSAGRRRAQRKPPRAACDSAATLVRSCSLDALALAPGRATQGFSADWRAMPHTAWPAFERGALVISEPLAWRLRLARRRVSLTLDDRARRARLRGRRRSIGPEYGNDRGTALHLEPCDLRGMWWQDDALTASEPLFAHPWHEPDSVVIARAARGRGRAPSAPHALELPELRELFDGASSSAPSSSRACSIG